MESRINLKYKYIYDMDIIMKYDLLLYVYDYE